MEERRKRRKRYALKEGATITAAVIAIFAATLLLSWAVTIGIIKLITMCFGWKFSLLFATGIWLIILLLRGIFQNGKD